MSDMVRKRMESGQRIKGRWTGSSKESTTYVPVCHRLPQRILTRAHRLNKMMVNRPREQQERVRDIKT
jgi:hypothetical protein